MFHTTDELSFGEAPFHYGELFFSRTDERGIIQAGNEVFQRLSSYPWSQLIGAHHEMVRHPDMPKGFFHIFWERLRAGESVSGYMKNVAQDGSHYWVYAIIQPVEGGYLSVRIKPGSQLFKAVAATYAALHEVEETEELSDEESAVRLLQRLQKMGYGNYDTFMAESLAAELAATDTALKRAVGERGQHFARLYQAVNEAKEHTLALCETFSAIEGIPHNMRILASRLEASGGPIAAISANYGSISQEISDWASGYVQGADSIFGRLDHSMRNCGYLSGVARVMDEVCVQFDGEADDPDCPVNRSDEKQQLTATATICRDKAEEQLGILEKTATRFSNGVMAMKRLIAGLSTTRMMCKIESASLPQKNESLTAIINQLDSFQIQMEEHLDQLAMLTAAFLTSVRALHATRRKPLKLKMAAG